MRMRFDIVCEDDPDEIIETFDNKTAAKERCDELMDTTGREYMVCREDGSCIYPMKIDQEEFERIVGRLVIEYELAPIQAIVTALDAMDVTNAEIIEYLGKEKNVVSNARKQARKRMNNKDQYDAFVESDTGKTVWASITGGDDKDVRFFNSCEEAVKAATKYWEHLSAHDKKRNTSEAVLLKIRKDGEGNEEPDLCEYLECIEVSGGEK